MSKKLIYFVSFALVLGMGFSLAYGDEGLIGYWKFDESSGTIATDSCPYRKFHPGMKIVRSTLSWPEARSSSGGNC